MKSCPWEGVVLCSDIDWALTGEEQLCCKGPGGPGEQQAEQEPAQAAKGPIAPGCMNRSRASRLKEAIVPLYLAHVRPHLEHYIQFWPPSTRKASINLL